MTPPFRPRFPWWGGDLQTLRNRFRHQAHPLIGMAEEFTAKTSDGAGDVLTGTLHYKMMADGPLILLMHGLTGDEDSAYMIETARQFIGRNHPVLRMNLRAAGSSYDTCGQFYCGNSWQDLFDTLAALPSEWTRDGVIPIGFSMGGNILVNALARLPEGQPVIAAATVSAPIDPLSASRRLMQRRNWVYQRALLDEMKETHLAKTTDPAIRNAIETTDSIYTFDNSVTAPKHGYRDAEDYYECTAGRRVLGQINLPLLMIHALDDPWIPAAPYLEERPGLPDHIEMLLPGSGGHVGFHSKGTSIPWHNRKIAEFVERL